jgi:hypothetical protein
VKRWGIPLLSALLLAGCGYRPATEAQGQILGNEIEFKQKISAKSPEVEAFVKDGLIENIYTILNKRLGSGGSVVSVKIEETDLTPIDYDRQGYPILYRAKVKILAKIEGVDRKLHTYSADGSYDFSVTSQGVVNHQLELTAFKRAASQAINKLLARIAIDGAKEQGGGEE